MGRALKFIVTICLLSELSRFTPEFTVLPTAVVDRASQSNASVSAIVADPLFRFNLEVLRPRPRNLRLVLVGDSVTRYQYLSLAYFLRHGSWWNPKHTTPNFVYGPSYHHPQHGDLDWAEFNFQTNRVLQPNEVCDCQRLDPFMLERRYFWDPVRNNTMVYIHLNGNTTTEPRRGYFGSFNATTFFSDWTRLLENAQPRRAFRLKRMVAWEYRNWSDVLQYHVARLRLGDSVPVVMNAGLHPHNMQSSHFRHVQNVTSLHLIWKTTTYQKCELITSTNITSLERQIMNDADEELCSNLHGCLNVSWTRYLKRKYLMDQVHFAEPVYRVMNEQLLQQLQLLPLEYNPLDLKDLLQQS